MAFDSTPDAEVTARDAEVMCSERCDGTASDAQKPAPRDTTRPVLRGRTETFIANPPDERRAGIVELFGSFEAFAGALNAKAPRGSMRAAYDYFRGK